MVALIMAVKGHLLLLLIFVRRLLVLEGFFQAMTFPISYDWAALFIRLAVGFGLLPYAVKKFNERSTADKFPKVLFFSRKAAFYSAMLIEGVVSICLILGFCTRLAAIPGIVNMGVAFTVSRGPYLTSPALVYFFMMIAILFIGSGNYSLDGLILAGLGG